MERGGEVKEHREWQEEQNRGRGYLWQNSGIGLTRQTRQMTKKKWSYE